MIGSLWDSPFVGVTIARDERGRLGFVVSHPFAKKKGEWMGHGASVVLAARSFIAVKRRVRQTAQDDRFVDM
jgi:hypothetical protein